MCGWRRSFVRLIWPATKAFQAYNGFSERKEDRYRSETTKQLVEITGYFVLVEAERMDAEEETSEFRPSTNCCRERHLPVMKTCPGRLENWI